MYKPPTAFSKEYPLAKIIDLMPSTDGTLRHVVILQEDKLKPIVAPVHHITRLEEPQIDTEKTCNIQNECLNNPEID